MLTLSLPIVEKTDDPVTFESSVNVIFEAHITDEEFSDIEGEVKDNDPTLEDTSEPMNDI